MEVLSDLRKESRSAFKSHTPTFTYSSGVLTSIGYSDGSVKNFSYTDGVLTRVDHVYPDRTIRKDFNYTLGTLTSISESVI